VTSSTAAAASAAGRGSSDDDDDDDDDDEDKVDVLLGYFIVCDYGCFYRISITCVLSPVQSARLSSTQLNTVSFSLDPVFVWPHDVNIPIAISFRAT